MKNLKLSFYLLFLSTMLCVAQPGNPTFGLTGSTLFDLDIRPISVMDLEVDGGGSPNINFTLTASSEAGIVFNSNPVASYSDIWLNYSCANPVVGSRHIDISISSGEIADGFELRLDIGSASAGGGGTKGSPNPSTIIISEVAQNVVTGIQSAFTGNGALLGHQLTFSLFYLTAQFDDIRHTNSNVLTLTYTLVDD